MGILNVTPDSFSDGGIYLDVEEALTRGYQIIEEGGDIIDIGGESTRPYSGRITADGQMARVAPVLAALAKHPMLSSNAVISIDTTQSAVAESAIAHGASLINDISAGMDDPRMFSVAARHDVPIVLMHMQGSPTTMQDTPSYFDVVGEVIDFLQKRVMVAQDAGIAPENIILDPGIGFGKRRNHNLSLLANLHRLVHLGYPVMLGASRKRFMGSICRVDEPSELLGATVATTAIGILAGVRLFRVHDVKVNREAADVTTCVQEFVS